MSLYYEAADILKAPNNAGGSLKSRIFSKKDFKSQPAQIYALVIETCKWSCVLKEIIEKTTLLRLERKLTPILSLLLVHDLLLAKRGIALPATHGLRTAVERHKARLQAEFTKARVRRQLGTLEAFTEYVEAGSDNTSSPAIIPHPRWIRINTLKTTLDDQLATTFKDYEHVTSISAVLPRGPPRLYLDAHIPNLVALPPTTDITKSPAYTSGALIIQDKASCFPAYLLDPLPETGDIIDTCAAPGNKTTHLASILHSHSADPDALLCPPERGPPPQTLHAFEKDKFRAHTLQTMVERAGCTPFTTIHAAQDFLKTDPAAREYALVGALLLDPSCSGSGIVGRDEMPELHVPDESAGAAAPTRKGKGNQRKKMPGSAAAAAAAAAGPADGAKGNGGLKRKRGEETHAAEREAEAEAEAEEEEEDEDEDEEEANIEILRDDDGNPTALSSKGDLEARLAALSAFQLALLLHAFAFPNAKRVTYSTCSIHAEENENVVVRALGSEVARQRGWRVLRRDEQVRGLREWDVRGDVGAVEGIVEALGGEGGEGWAVAAGQEQEVAGACIRAQKGDGRGTMGFFVCGFIRDDESAERVRVEEMERKVLRDEEGQIVRDVLGFPVLAESDGGGGGHEEQAGQEDKAEEADEEAEWGGISDDDVPGAKAEKAAPEPKMSTVPSTATTSQPAKKRRRKGKK